MINMIGGLIKATDPSEAWIRGLCFILDNGDEFVDERGTSITEVLHLQTVIRKPFGSRSIPVEFGWDEAHLDIYAKQLLDPESRGFVYTYGNRMCNWGGEIDQIKMVINRLNASRATRRASISTWIPTLDHNTEEVPCMMVADFKCRDGKLNLGIYFRSHDFCCAYPANVYGMAQVLKFVSTYTNLKPGWIVTNSASAHIYGRDLEWVKTMLGA